MRILFATIAILFLSSCAGYKLINAKSVNVKGMNVQPQTMWSKTPDSLGNNVELWTVDGRQLNQLIFIGALANNQRLFTPPSKELPMPVFKAGMLPNEMQDLVSSSLKNLYGGDVDITTSNLRPTEVAGQIGFRFNLSYFTKNGLAKQGDVLVLEKDKRLYSMIFIATKLHYFDKHAPEFDHMANSIII
ncbi:hypothetical protein [Alteromonas sp. a30]|uniref:hypothetical protein n=1 Tax=Alteromonas sp. a30 TaxID=2730917 RepID=UPI00227F5504|nr:hypothetical protein [Alteromonas sp. a30]MCY7294951.1 hypothetical protein [Alteromonas sp. a30]